MTEANSENYTMTFVAGLVLGAAVTALLAPRSGHQMRKIIKDKAVRAGVKATTANDELHDETKSRLEDAKQLILQGIDKMSR